MVVLLSINNGFGQTYHSLSGSSLIQDWSNTGLITVNDNWSGVPSIRGFRGDGGTSTTGVDPQTVLSDLSGVPNVIANATDPANSTGGISEFEITDPVVAFQGSGTADAPNLVFYINSTGCSNIKIKYDLRDLDGSADNAVQAVALQYRIGETGNYINIPSAFVADASTGPSLADLVTKVDAMLPSACYNQAQLQLRIITTNAGGNDENIGIDNIVVEVDATAPVPAFVPASAATGVLTNVKPVITFNESILKTDGSAVVDADLAALVTLKETDASGSAVAFTATIDAAKKVITVTPSASLKNSQLYYLAVGPVEDVSGNESTTVSTTFTTISATAPILAITGPLGGEILYAGAPATISWTSANIANVLVEVYVMGESREWHWEPMIPAPIPAIAGKADVTIPGDALYGTKYRIRLSDATNASLSSTSGEFTIIAVATSLADMKLRCIPNDIVRITGETVVTFLRPTNRNQKYIQDANAGLLIDDAGAVLTTPVAIGDKISGLEGKLGLYLGVLQIVPTMPTVSIVSTGNSVSIPSMTIPEYNASYTLFQSMLVKITNVSFPLADGTATFASSTSYNVTDGTNILIFRTFYAGDGNIVGSVIPSGNYNITALAGANNTTPQIYSRTTSDFEFITGIRDGSEMKIEMFPVPAVSELKVRNIMNVKTIEIIDVSGKVIRTTNPGSDSELIIPVSDLKKGIYFVRFNTAGGTIIRRFVK